jgi:hypothetical protein
LSRLEKLIRFRGVSALSNDEILCRVIGSNASIELSSCMMSVRMRNWKSGPDYELPLNKVRSVIVERKSVMPFATMTVLSSIVGVILKYNALWFFVELSPSFSSKLSAITFLVSLALAVPTLSRTVFVNVLIGSVNSAWRIRFVSAKSGVRLAAKFQQLTSGSQV